MGRRFRHLSFTERLKIETYLKCGKKPCEIANEIGVHFSTIYREIKRGQYEHLNTDWTTEKRYSPDKAREKYKMNLKAKGPELKIGSDIRLAQYIEYKIIYEKYSPGAVLGEIRAKNIRFDTTISRATLYSYIDKGIFLHLTNKNLPVKANRKRGYKRVRPAKIPRGESIEQRAKEIDSRCTFGHWEMDTVIGKQTKGRVLLVLTERLTRWEIIIPMKDKTAGSVKRIIDRLERKHGAAFRSIFKSITVDNGPEFSDCAGIEKSKYTKGKRTKVYYCHPYSSWERGSNENQNRMIRRMIPKGADLNKIPVKVIKEVERWLNNYPRGIFEYKTSEELFQKYIKGIA